MADKCAADWLREGVFSARHLSDMESHRMMMHLGELQSQKKYAPLVGTVEAEYPNGIRVKRFADVHPALIAATGYLGLGNREKAAELVRRVAALTLPDGILIQLIYYNQLLDGLVKECIVKEYSVLCRQFEETAARYLERLSSVYPKFSADELPPSLTMREREVAMLAIEGLSNNEIAGKLFLTTSTVYTHLRAVFRKLDIDRRSKPAEKLC